MITEKQVIMKKQLDRSGVSSNLAENMFEIKEKHKWNLKKTSLCYTVKKIQQKQNTNEESSLSHRLRVLLAGKCQQKRYEVSVHLVCTVRKKREMNVND